MSTTASKDTLPGADVTGVVRAPIAEVWARIRAFGPEMMGWWPYFEWVRLEEPGRDEVGCVRAFRTTAGRTYRQRLVARDDQAMTMTYELLEMHPWPPTMKSLVSTIALHPKGAHETVVHWTSRVDASALVTGKVIAVEEETHGKALEHLDRSFNPSLGRLDLRVIGAKGLARHGLLPPDPYVVADLDRSGHQATSTATRTTHPRWGDVLTFDVRSLEGGLQLGVWDARVLGHDDFLGSAELDLHELPAGAPVLRDLPLREVPSGVLTIEATLTLAPGVERLGHSAEAREHHHAERLYHVIGGLREQAMELFAQLGQDDPPIYGYARYPRDPACPDEPFERLPRLVAGYPAGQLLAPRKLGHVVERLTEYVYAQGKFGERLAAPGADPWRAVFGGPLSAPEPVIANWEADEEFARQLIQGLNPMVIARLTDPARIPPALAGLTAQGLDTAGLAAAGRLFVLDYELLDGLPLYRDMVFYAPIALVYRELLPGGGSRLNLLGFQLERGPDAEVFVRGTTPPNRYKLARLHLACADNQYHQFIYHLGFAHLAMEPLAIAHHNAFPADHPIGRFLAPHFRDAIGVNMLARQTLLSPVAPLTDRTFSPGTVGLLRLFLRAYERWDFWGNSFPAHLAARGFDEARGDGVEGFAYRDDGFLLWNALGDYVHDVVAAIYADDAAVSADAVLQAWAAECADPERADVRSFPARLDSRELLVRTLVNIVFTASAQHSALNLPQWDYLSYVPNRPDSLFAKLPPDGDELDATALQAALPGFAIVQFQAMVAHLLTAPSEHRLIDLEGAREQFPAIHARHVARFEAIAATIRERDAALTAAGQMPYPYLSPDRVAASTDV